MKRALALILALCCFTIVAEAQKTKVLLEQMQNETQSLQRRVDSLQRICWKNEATISVLKHEVERLTDKLSAQTEEFNKKLLELASIRTVPEKPFEYVDAALFNSDRLRVKHGGLFGYIDRGESLSIPCMYDEAKDFNDGYAIVKKEGQWGVIDSAGNIIVPFEYDKIEDGHRTGPETQFVVAKNDEFGVINSYGKTIIPLKYESISGLDWGGKAYHYQVRLNLNYGIIDSSGKIILKPIYWAVFQEGGLKYSAGGDYYDLNGNPIKKNR